MLRLAVATNAETYERMQTPLRERGIDAEFVRSDERTVALTDGPADGASGGSDERRSPGGPEEFAGFDAGFVYPSRIMEGAVADAFLEVPWVNDREAVLTSRNKAGVIAELSTAGVPVPETVLVSNPADTAEVVAAFERFDPPVVIKPNSATRGVGVAKAGDLDSFLGIVDYLDLVHDYRATGDRSFLVQEFLPNTRDYRVMCIDGEYAGAVERHPPADALAAGQWKHNVHRGADAEGVDLPSDLRDVAERAAATLGILWLGVDLLVTDGRTVVSETNARPTIDSETKYEPGFYDDLAALIRRTA